MLDDTESLKRKRHTVKEPALVSPLESLRQPDLTEESMPTARGTPTRLLTLRDTTNISKGAPSFQSGTELDTLKAYAAECDRIGSWSSQAPVSTERDAYFELSQSLQSLQLPAVPKSFHSDELPTARSTMKLVHRDQHLKSGPNETDWRLAETLAPKGGVMWEERKASHDTSRNHVPLLHMFSPKGPRDPSTLTDEAHSYTEIFRDPVGGRPFHVPQEYASLMGIPCLHTPPPCGNPYEMTELRCDKCMENIPHGNFREHNVICRGKQCNRCFQTVIGSFESHKVSCPVRRCDRCGLIPRETFKEHNRICKLISSSLWERWHSREKNGDFGKGE